MADALNLEQTIRQECLPLRDCMLTITDSNGEAAFLYFKEGELIEANYAALWGKEALAQIVTWNLADRTIAPLPLGIKRSLWDQLEFLLNPSLVPTASGRLPVLPTFRAQKTGSTPFDRYKAIAGLLRISRLESGKEAVLFEGPPERGDQEPTEWMAEFAARVKSVGDTLGFGHCDKWTIDTDKCQIVGLRHEEYFFAMLRRKDAMQDDLEVAGGRGDGGRLMATKVDDALKKVTALPGVKAAFVFDQFHSVVARDVPGQYSNDILKRIASQLYSLAAFSGKQGSATQEFRLVYDKYAVYTRVFARTFFLVVFMDRALQPADFRQPLNLAVLVLDRALRSDESFESSRTIAKFAELAETSLKEGAETDESFSGQFRRLCVTFLGQSGRDLIDLAVEELYLIPPVKTEKDMRRLRDFAVAHVVHPLKRKIIKQESDDLIRRTLSLL